MLSSSDGNGLLEAFSALKVLQHLDRIQGMREGRIVPPVTVELDPTNLCNHRCVWCLDQRFREECHDSLAWEVVRKLIEELAEMGVKGVVVKGSGEPTLVPYLPDILYLLRRLGIRSALTTNGSLLSGDKARAVVECCDWVRVSVDAATAETHQRIHRPVQDGDFERILNNIRGLVAMKRSLGKPLVIGYKFSADENNLHEILEATRLARALGVDNISLRGVDLACHGLEDSSFRLAQAEISTRIEEAARLTEPGFTVIAGGIRRPARIRSCLASDLVAVVSANGHMYACLDLKGQERFDMGSVLEEGFRGVWYGKKRMDVRGRIQSMECRSRCSLKYDGYNRILEAALAKGLMHSEFL
jgi:cyclic pyranopterin phosphate synthase